MEVKLRRKKKENDRLAKNLTMHAITLTVAEKIIVI